jgi:hypothetical protein
MKRRYAPTQLAAAAFMLLGAPGRLSPLALQIFVALFLSTSVVVATELSPRYFAAKPGALTKSKERLAAGDKVMLRALESLIEEADEALQLKPQSVTEKAKLPPSGDLHDYMSLAPYFWPDPAKKDGLPYLRKDGRVNPESRDDAANDGPRGKRMAAAVEALALAYYFTGKEAYANHAARLVRAWFLDSATRMNPHLRYAQAILGKNDGRGMGIIESRSFARVGDAAGLLAGSKAWTKKDQQALSEWLAAYLDWLITSEPGKEERAAKNNHGSWYDSQAVRFALCIGRTELARQMLEDVKTRRIAVQLEPNGRQPLELSRTASFGYSRFNLDALCELATMGEHLGVDLWNYRTADGRSLRRAIDFLLPFVEPPAKAWPYEQIKDKQEGEFLPLLRQAALAYRAPAYEAVIGKFPDSPSKRFQLLFLK